MLSGGYIRWELHRKSGDDNMIDHDVAYELRSQLQEIEALIHGYEKSRRLAPDAILTVFEVAAVLDIKLDLYGESVPESHKP